MLAPCRSFARQRSYVMKPDRNPSNPREIGRNSGSFVSIIPTVVMAVSLLGAAAWLLDLRSSAEDAHMIPAPAVDIPAGDVATSEVAVLAGGCFWGVQGVFQHVKGVTNAVSG